MSLATIAQYRDAKIVLASVNDDLYTDEQLQEFLDYATAYLESQCYQQLEIEAYEEILTVGSLYCSIDPALQLNVFIKKFPVVQVTALYYKLLPSDDWTEIDTDLWAFSSDENRITVPYSLPIPRYKWAQVKVNYSAGYTEEQLASTEAGDLVFACCLMAAHFASMGYAAIDIRSEMIRQVLPRDAMTIVDQTINRYQRQF